MINFFMPNWVKNIIQIPLNIKEMEENKVQELKEKLARFSSNTPLVSIIIPAWNEEEGILHTLISLAQTNTQYEAELLVIDNNSTDGTPYLLNLLGVKTILETKQGVGHARTRGLHEAKGKFVLSGDSDTLYPAGWITAMVDGMKNNGQVYCVGGSYSFLPSNNTPRWQYAFYEFLSGFIIRKKQKTKPFQCALGFNSGFVRQKGIDVNGYELEVQRTFRGAAGVIEKHATEDGMMAWRLMQAGGEVKVIPDLEARAWTSDRRIQMDGGIKSAMKLRINKYLFKK